MSPLRTKFSFLLPHSGAFLTFTFLLILLRYDNGMTANLLLLLLTAVGVFYYLLQQMRCSKALFFQTHVMPGSFLEHFRTGYLFLALVALAFAAIGTLALLIFLLTLPFWILAPLISAQLLFSPLNAYLYKKLKPHLKPLSRELSARMLTIALLGTLSTLLLACGKLWDIEVNYSALVTMSSEDVAHTVRDTITYSPIWFQDVARTFLMLELELLRATFFLQDLHAWTIRIFFLLPSAAPALTLTMLHAGFVSIFLQKPTSLSN